MYNQLKQLHTALLNEFVRKLRCTALFIFRSNISGCFFLQDLYCQSVKHIARHRVIWTW